MVNTGQACDGGVHADRVLERVWTIVVAIVGDEQYSQVLAALPNDRVGIGWIEAGFGKCDAAQMQVVPELAPRLRLHAQCEQFDLSLNSCISQQSDHRCAPAGPFSWRIPPGALPFSRRRDEGSPRPPEDASAARRARESAGPARRAPIGVRGNTPRQWRSLPGSIWESTV